jgi:leucyl-tRNA synthetase
MNQNKQKYYCIPMLPYPSGKLHIGHVRNYTITDILARYHKLNGYNVRHNIGWDAFGLPAENAAIQFGCSPHEWTIKNINHMRSQLKRLLFDFNWDMEINTCEPDYYKHQQWLFLQLYKKGIIYRKTGLVNFDPVDQTVLANEQVIDGRGWRSGALIEKREIPMYYMNITRYADELLTDLNNLPNWPEQIKIMQRNWIGKSQGAEITFKSDHQQIDKITVFTSLPNTIMGMSFLGISPNHELSTLLAKSNSDIKKFIDKENSGAVDEATLATKEKRGIFTGCYAIHPITNEKKPIWICNFILLDYGTGAIMGVPALDERDQEFSEKYKIDIPKLNYSIDEMEIICSKSPEIMANHHIMQSLIDMKVGKLVTKYRLRDWGISRQRYWGCPIPIIHCPNCGEVLVPEKDLPVLLPTDLVPDGKSNPLLQDQDFINTNCPTCGASAKRETDTMDTFVDSSWYFLRYTCANYAQGIFNEDVNYWAPVDQYVGGVEHAILHLLYARFLCKAMADLNLIKFREPFNSLMTQGMVLADCFYRENDNGIKTWYNFNDLNVTRDNKGNVVSATSKKDGAIVVYGGMEKMSKSKNNGLDPDDLVEQYGADALRLFMMFVAPPALSLQWNENGIIGADRFIKKLIKLVEEMKLSLKQNNIIINEPIDQLSLFNNLDNAHQDLLKQLNHTILKVQNDFTVKQQFNTAIAAVMELINAYAKLEFISESELILSYCVLNSAVVMLSPIIPDTANTMFNISKFPVANQEILNMQEEYKKIIVQVNGKLRANLEVSSSLNKEEIEKMATESVCKYLEDKPIKKIVYVERNQLVNIVI